MSVGTLGSAVDIHGGGTDLVFAHHECKRAIVEAITGRSFVKHWVHAGVVTYAGERMSKSLGNLVFVGDILRSCEPMVLRLALMSHHYRSGFEWHNSMLEPARQLLDRLRCATHGAAGADPRARVAEVRAGLDDDLDVPRAVRAVADLADSIIQGGSDSTAVDGLLTCCNSLGLLSLVSRFS